MTRLEQELNILERISQILGSGLELSEVFQRAMSLLCDELHFEISVLNLMDPATDTLRTLTSVGLTADGCCAIAVEAPGRTTARNRTAMT